MSTTTSMVTGVDFVSVPTQALFEDPDGNSLDIHHRYAPPGAQP